MLKTTSAQAWAKSGISLKKVSLGTVVLWWEIKVQRNWSKVSKVVRSIAELASRRRTLRNQHSSRKLNQAETQPCRSRQSASRSRFPVSLHLNRHSCWSKLQWCWESRPWSRHLASSSLLAKRSARQLTYSRNGRKRKLSGTSISRRPFSHLYSRDTRLEQATGAWLIKSLIPWMWW